MLTTDIKLCLQRFYPQKLDSDLHVCPEVRSFHEETEDGLTMEAVFKCLFQPVPGNIEYDVDWYIDGTLVNNASFSRVSYSNINDTTFRPRHWTNNFTMSFQVSKYRNKTSQIPH